MNTANRAFRPSRPIAALLAAGIAAAAGLASAAPDLDAVDAGFAARRTPGAALATLRDGTVDVVHVTGQADVAGGRAVAADTPFRAGSVSKMVTAVVVLQLVQEGKLSLDDRVADRAPWLRVDNPWEATDPLRIVHLLEHTTGWADLGPREFALDDDTMSVPDALAVGGVRRSRHRPGAFHAYTSAGYGVLGEIVAGIEGRPFADVARDRVFAPLGMASATYALPDTLAKSYLPDGAAVAPQRYPLAAAAGLVVDIGDLARFARFLLDGRADDGTVLLTPASLQRMERAETSLAARAGVPHGYGLGNMGYVGEHAVFRGHGGAIDAFGAELRYARDCGCGFVVLANGGNVPPAVTAALEAAVRGAGDTNATTSGDSSTSESTVAASATVDPAAFAGIYQPIAQRNRLLGPIDAMTTFAKGEPAGDGRFLFDGVVRTVDARGRLQRPDRVAPTAALTRDGDTTLIVGPLANWQRVPGWTVAAKAAWAVALLTGILAALVLAIAAHWRRRPAALAWGTVAAVLPLPLLGVLFAVAAGLPPAQSIATFGAPTPLSIGVAVATLAIPVAALLLGWRAFRSRDAGRAIRVVAGTVAVLLVIASVWLAGWGWIGLRTWAI